jgi:hypothetical protein
MRCSTYLVMPMVSTRDAYWWLVIFIIILHSFKPHPFTSSVEETHAYSDETTEDIHQHEDKNPLCQTSPTAMVL